ncbi:hypothetical protein [Pseudomaricurvus sp. HS19]|uniref:hypothetical protein n=1 Tax=Pseudomaricurvus sp. HS19 TaxID=2692626 RepID=UPI0013707AA7|nr:hypothetical protein [Pseudomaricurvus sp. HS19]MYM64911.1 hypothetical protein [Pseudomaricurvus sp. HS19]
MLRILVYLSLLVASGVCLGNGLNAPDTDSQWSAITALESNSLDGEGDSTDPGTDEESQAWLTPAALPTFPLSAIAPIATDAIAAVVIASVTPPIRAPPAA